MRKLLLRWYWKLEKWIFPGLRYSQYHYYDTLKASIHSGVSWLDLGCGHQMFASWMTAEEREFGGRAARLIGIDLDFEGLKRNAIVTGKIYGDLVNLPLSAATFDIVTANMVVEHLEFPEDVLREVSRVLRPGGRFILHTPNKLCLMMRISALLPRKIKLFLIWALEGRAEDDVFKTYYRLNTPADVAARAAGAGLKVSSFRLVSTSALTAMLGPVAIVELLYLRLLERDAYQGMRSNLIAILEKA